MTNSTWPDLEADYSTQVDTNVAILRTAIYIITVPIGIAMIYGIVLYEHVGVDPKKRSIFNQLISATFINFGVDGLIVNTAITIRCWTGPFGHIVGKVVAILRRFCFTFILTNVTDIMIYKNLCLLKPHWILTLDDDLWMRFLMIWNVIWAVGSSNLEWYLSSTNPRIYLFLSGQDDVISATLHSKDS